MKVTILFNQPGTSTTENIAGADDDTASSAKQAKIALDNLGYDTELLGIIPEQIKVLSEKLKDVDVVLNLIEWTGRDLDKGAEVIKKLEEMKIKFTGCDARGYLLSGDKIKMKQRLSDGGIATPKYFIVDRAGKYSHGDLTYPLIVKPALEHCGIGIGQKSIVSNEDELRARVEEIRETFKQAVVVEEFIEGKEAHVAVIEKDNQPRALTPAIFKYKEKTGYWGIMSYEAKWGEGWETHMTEWDEQMDNETIAALKKTALKTFKELNGRSLSRVDMRVRGAEIFVLEINHNPGIGWEKDSGLYYSCLKEGISYADLIKLLIQSAV